MIVQVKKIRGSTGVASAAEKYHHELEVREIFEITVENLGRTALQNLLACCNFRFEFKNMIFSSGVDVTMLVTYKELIDLARKMLCKQEVYTLQETMHSIKDELMQVEPALAVRLVPDCRYRGGECFKQVSCGRFKQADIMHYAKEVQNEEEHF